MKKSVLISLKGTQDADGEEILEMQTVGKYSKKGDIHYITYEESELTGMEGTTTTLIAEPQKVTLMRQGTSNTMMVFERGQKHLCCYETPYGAFTIGVSADKVAIDLDELDEKGGKIKARYAIDIDNVYKSENNFNMTLEYLA